MQKACISHTGGGLLVVEPAGPACHHAADAGSLTTRVASSLRSGYQRAPGQCGATTVAAPRERRSLAARRSRSGHRSPLKSPTEQSRAAQRLTEDDPCVDRRVIIKQGLTAKLGARELADTEVWMNRRARRSLSLSRVCAPFVGAFEVGDESGAGGLARGATVLVWEYEGERTLESFLTAPDWPYNLEPVAALLSPALWLFNRPHLFDTYSCGILLLQMSFDFSLLDANRGAGFELACSMVALRGGVANRFGRKSASEALLHRFFRPGALASV
eukprot:PRCOL_00005393-RA